MLSSATIGHRWHKINMEGTCYPLQEGQLWQYLRSMAEDGSAATKASSMVQAVPFAWFILQLDGTEHCIASRRILVKQLAGKRATRQARPLNYSSGSSFDSQDGFRPGSTWLPGWCVSICCWCYTADVAIPMLFMSSRLCMIQLVTTSNRVVMDFFSYQPVTTSHRGPQKASHCFFP